MANVREVREERRPVTTRERVEARERHDLDVRIPAVPQTMIVNRVSWGAIFAGGFVALSAQFLLTLLGIAIGLSVLSPLGTGSLSETVGIAAGVWWIVTGIISLLLGGWTAGRLSGMSMRQDAMMNGIIAWAVVTFISFLLVGTGTGAIIGGTFDNVSDFLAVSAWWALLAMVAGLIAAAAGGALGAPRDLRIFNQSQNEHVHNAVGR